MIFNTDSLAKIRECFYIHDFMLVIDALKQPADSEKQTLTFYLFAYICFQLKQIVSIVYRVVNITLQDLTQLKQYYRKKRLLLFIVVKYNNNNNNNNNNTNNNNNNNNNNKVFSFVSRCGHL